MKSILLLSTLLFGTLLGHAQQLYFPAPQANSPWETSDPSVLGWCTDQLPPLLDFLEGSNTKAFIVLKDGKIVIEEYFGTFTADSNWYWASAGKSLTSFLVGRAQQEGFLDINEPTSTYLGTGWTSLTPQQEEAITVWHQLTMTSGLNDGIPNNNDCTAPSCLQYLAPPGTRWAYHNGPYTLLDGVITGATGLALNNFLFTRLTQSTGIAGLYIQTGNNNVFYSKARAMARFGLLMQGGAAWNGNPILSDMTYYNAMITPSQDLNEAYGYLWWLNGQSSYLLPGIQFPLSGPAMPNAPMDVYAALGKNGQIINVSPSTGIVVVRMGDLPGGIFVPNVYNDQIWQYLNAVLCSSTGLSDASAISRLHVFPNPATDRLELLIDATFGTGILRISDATGRTLRLERVTSHNVQLDISSLSQGSYHASIFNENGVATVRFMKQ
jgi:CubicO group peptidase (beta-lactamase class C family)